MSTLVPALVLTFVNATTPAPDLEAKSLQAVQATVGQAPATAIVQQSSATIINVGNLKGNIAPTQFRDAATNAGAATGCKIVSFENSKFGKAVDAKTGKIQFSSTPAAATLDCAAK